MKLYKFELEAFITYLHTLKLERKSSRMRTKFKNILIEKLQEFYEDMSEINLSYAQKDEVGNPIISEGRLVFLDDGNRLEDLKELSYEIVSIEENEENYEMLLSVKESVLHHSPLEYEGDDADRYDRFCEIVEQIKY